MHLFRYCSPARLFPPSTMPLVFLSSRLQTEGRKVESSPAKAGFPDSRRPIIHSFRLTSPGAAFWVRMPIGLFMIRKSPSSYSTVIPCSLR